MNRRSPQGNPGGVPSTGHRPPRWPDQTVPQQSHLDFTVDDLDEAERQLLQLGARKPEHQPHEDRWRVLTDPAGHPFCLVRG
ncbi:VOC family protein [Streptomyces justiciae]|uniref:VOC family protein n=1 Tax=Streptomyces justiciae TaxID=2780140 RepID=A0ABU3LVU1_9ACTN|nr:VOC family protein [Streptomyces justiciae]MDT7843350.1 VOC family protein [Streptomyces justiciae]